MPPTQPAQPIDLGDLAEQYEILGELAGADGATVHIARRREDGADVQIAVHTAPQGDEGNALSHLAADVNLLEGANVPGLATILGGKWVGQEAFAIVTRRVAAPTLDELLFRRDEQFSLARIAATLSQVNAVITWARDRKVVHRCVSPRSVYIEPGADRVIVAFTPRALPLTDMPGVEEDGRTIAQLASAMLTRATPDRAGKSLRELRPGLPESVLAQADALLSPSRDAERPDVVGFIGAIAMADALKAGEDHLETTRNLIEEQKRAHQAQLEQERAAHDAELAEQRAAHEKTVEDQARRFQKERAEFEDEIAQANAKLEKERAALADEREAHRRDCDRFRVEREESEREITRVREQLEWESASLATQAELYAQTDEFKTPAPGDRPAIVPARATGRGESVRAWFRRPMAAATVAVLVVFMAAIAVALTQGGRPASQPERVVDSVAGGVESLPAPEPVMPEPPPAAAVAPVPADLLTGVAARADSAPPVPWWRRALRRNRPDTTARIRPVVDAEPDTAPKLDTIFTAPVIRPRIDSVLRRDSLRRDSIRRDSIRRDTLRRDTSVIRDTLVRRDTLR